MTLEVAARFIKPVATDYGALFETCLDTETV